MTLQQNSGGLQFDGRTSVKSRAAPLIVQVARGTQAHGWYVPMPLALPEIARRQSCEHLNQLLADTITLRDLYKKHHWQVSGPTFYALHLLFDRHAQQQSEIIDLLAERVMILGGVSVAMGSDVAEMTLIPRPPKGRETVPAQISRLLHAHEIVLEESRTMARMATEVRDDGTNDLIVSNVFRVNEAQVWFLAEQLVEGPVGRLSDELSAAADVAGAELGGTADVAVTG